MTQFLHPTGEFVEPPGVAARIERLVFVHGRVDVVADHPCDHVHDVVPVVAERGQPLHGRPGSGGSPASSWLATTWCCVMCRRGLNGSPPTITSSSLRRASSNSGCCASIRNVRSSSSAGSGSSR